MRSLLCASWLGEGSTLGERHCLLSHGLSFPWVNPPGIWYVSPELPFKDIGHLRIHLVVLGGPRHSFKHNAGFRSYKSASLAVPLCSEVQQAGLGTVQ